MSTHGKPDHIKNAIRNNIKKSITKKNYNHIRQIEYSLLGY